jgi:hypothetical protein
MDMNPHNNPFIDFADLNQEIEKAHLSDLIDFYLCDGCGLLYEVNASSGACSECSHCGLSCPHTPDLWSWK